MGGKLLAALGPGDSGRELITPHPQWTAHDWIVVDDRTGRPASAAAYRSRASAQVSIDVTRHNVETGRRPDLADLIDHLIPWDGNIPWPTTSWWRRLLTRIAQKLGAYTP